TQLPPTIRAPRGTVDRDSSPAGRRRGRGRGHRAPCGSRDRRRWLWDHESMTPDSAVAPALDELTITIVVDNATDTLSSISAGMPQLPEMAYLLGGVPPSGQHDGHDCVEIGR